MQAIHLCVFSKHQNRHKPNRIAFLMLAASFMFGCASKTPLISPIDSKSSHSKHYSYRNKAAYNRPYTIKGKTYYPMRSAIGYSARGIASWYGSESGNRTAMGTRFRPEGLTAAHKTLPLPTKIRVTNLQNGRSVVVTVNDRGPFKHNRLIDLSFGAAKRIGLSGLTKVKIDYIDNMLSQND
jgi:rare lipoprotein A